MRLLHGFSLAACLALSLSLGGSVADAGIVCGMFDGTFKCKSDPKAGTQFGKNATPGAPIRNDETSPEVPAPGEEGLPPAEGSRTTNQSGAGAADPTACQNGMVGTPPNCQCPKNSELLGGNCVHYTASACNNGLASDALPQACRGVEEKLSCRLRDDGLKDCCCVTYDKF
ncbi:MAG TPA: hypothetical protein VHK26_10105 [Methyloceanibacter sp.]|jgi:hypothetical protein|nr:hypothetical protein [Methyloceanibacter sp.]